MTLHNVFSLPKGLDEKSLLFARLIRDADKLDILRVVLEYFEQDAGTGRRRSRSACRTFPDITGSPCRLARGELARKDALRTLNDFKLLQLAWIYDLNFTCSLRMVEERGYIRTLAEMLPRNEEIAGAVEIVSDYVSGKLKTR